MTRKVAGTTPSPLVRKIQFATVGVSVMLLGYGVLFFCVELLGLNKSISYAIQAIVSIEVNFAINYHVTWRDRRGSSVWGAFKRYHAVRAFTLTGNQLLYNGLLSIGIPYLVANTICVMVTTVFNYIVGDRFTFRAKPVVPSPVKSTAETALSETATVDFPRFSVVIPVKNNGDSIRDTVKALLQQDYPYAPEIIVVGDRIDTSWDALEGIDGDVQVIRAGITSPGRDSNMKRDLGLQHASRSSTVLAVIDGDVIVDAHWMRLVANRLQGDVRAVAGPVSGIGNGFWTDYIDRNPTASKTPRIKGSFLLDSKTLARKKPPVTANFALTRELYEEVGGPNVAFTNSYEDYEWFSRIIQSGHGILCDSMLSSTRYHREGLRPLINEYRRSGRGCADHIATHFPHCPFAVKRVKQLAVLYSASIVGCVALVFAPLITLLAGLVGVIILSMYTSVKVGRPAALSYPFISVLFSTMFAYGLTRQLIRRPQLVEPTLTSLNFGMPVRPAEQSGFGGDPAAEATVQVRTHFTKRKRSRAFWLAFVAIIVVAAVLRFWEIPTRPGYDWDESVYQAIGANMAQHDLLQAVPDYGSPAEPYLYHPPFYFVMLRFWFQLFGSGVTQARILAATGSLVMLILLGLWLRKLIGGKWALLTVSVLAVDGWTVFTNRVGWFENTMMPLGIIALWLYSRSVKHPTSIRFATVGGILGLVTVYKHVGVYFLLAVLIDWLIRRTNTRKYLMLVAASLTVIASYIGYMSVVYNTTYWRESTVQVQRILGLRESRGAIDSVSDLITPLLAQYKIFALSLILVMIGAVFVMVRIFQMVKQHSTAPLGENTILFAWAAASLVVFVGMQLKLPHYFIMIIVPMFCFLGNEMQRRPARHHIKLSQWATAIAIIGIGVGNLAVFNARIVDHTDNALQQTAQWVNLNVPTDALILTEEPVGSLVDRHYCKFGHAERCANDVQYIITYTSHTQQPPDTATVHELLASSTAITEFDGFKERLTIYRVN